VFFVMRLQDVKAIDNIALMPFQTKENPRCELPVVLRESESVKHARSCVYGSLWSLQGMTGLPKGGNPETQKKPIEENPVNNWESRIGFG